MLIILNILEAQTSTSELTWKEILIAICFWGVIIIGAILAKKQQKKEQEKRNRKRYRKTYKQPRQNEITKHEEIENQCKYSAKNSLMTNAEKDYYIAIREVLEEKYILQPQINLATIIEKNILSRYQNELFRNIDFGIFDENYKPLILIEINDNTHLEPDRRARDKKVKQICYEANIPLITFWMSYGINKEYIKKRINEILLYQQS